MIFKKITNIQTFELLEERLGISLSGLSATTWTQPDVTCIRVRAEIIALNGGQVEQDFKIQISITDSMGNVLATDEKWYSKDNFFGLDVLNVTLAGYNFDDVNLIKVFPVKN